MIFAMARVSFLDWTPEEYQTALSHWLADCCRKYAMPVRIYLTDPVRLEVEGRVFDDWRRVGRQGRLIFAILAAEHLRPVAVDELAEELWPDQLPASSER